MLLEIITQIDENHNFEQARVLDQSYKNRRFTYQFRSTALIQKLPANPNPLTRKRPKTDKSCLKMKEKSTRKSRRVSKY